MKRTTTLMAAAFAATVGTAHAQIPSATIRPSDMGIRDTAQVERSVEADGDPTTMDFVLVDYTAIPPQRAVMQITADQRVCVGPFSYWFGDNPYIWPTWITIDGRTRVHWVTDNGQWAIAELELPSCPAR